MFSKTKYEDNPELSSLVSNPHFRTMFCPAHGYIYQFRCIYEHCKTFLCGKIQCIDNHFHQNQLNIEKFNAATVVTKIQKIEDLSHLAEAITPVMTQLREAVHQLKDRSTDLFKLYKDYRKASDYLTQHLQDPLSMDYIKTMDHFGDLRGRIEGDIVSISQRINWSNIWITLQDELQIIQKLKINFIEFKSVYFEHLLLDQSSLLRKNEWQFLQDEICEGIILLYFTNEQYVIGEYISNNNIETCNLFLHNFIFIVNLRGEIQQYQTSKETISISQDQLNQHHLKITDKALSLELAFEQLSIRKIMSFRAFMQGQ